MIAYCSYRLTVCGVCCLLSYLSKLFLGLERHRREEYHKLVPGSIFESVPETVSGKKFFISSICIVEKELGVLGSDSIFSFWKGGGR